MHLQKNFVMLIIKIIFNIKNFKFLFKTQDHLLVNFDIIIYYNVY